MNLLYPWIDLKNPKLFEEQLDKELISGHVLFGISVKAIARIDGDDDYLFSLLDGTNRVAVVHLSFGISVSPEWPWTEMYPNYAEWESKRMLRDSSGTNA
jgi:hypothetical protein